MKKIKLTQNKYTLVDNADYANLNQYKWYAHKERGSFYAIRKTYYANKRITFSMHRQILGLKKGDKHQGDHRDHNTLNNQRYNLRISTVSQNQMN